MLKKEEVKFYVALSHFPICKFNAPLNKVNNYDSLD